MPQKPDASVVPATPGERLRELRRMAGRSQREFAADLGVSEATYQRAEAGGTIGGDLLMNLTKEAFSADWVLQGKGHAAMEAVEENLALLERLQSAGLTVPNRSQRAAQSFDLPRLVDAYEAAHERIKAPMGRPPDPYKLMELTLTLYDALTISAEVMAAQKEAGKGKS